MKGRIYQKQNGALVDITPDALPIVAARNIGETVFSLAPLSDAGLHLLDGSVLSAGGMYAEAVAHFAALQADYPNLFVTEAAWQTSVSTYGVCGKFVYDSGAGTLRLPKVTGHIAGTIDPTAIGDLIEAGLPNITGKTAARTLSTTTGAEGAFYRGSANGTSFSVSGTERFYELFIDASRSSSIYGNSDTVQPQAIKGFVYMVVSNRTKTQIVADIDEISADLQLKADVDLGNVTSAGQVRMAHAAMPKAGVKEDISITGESMTYIAPADGYVVGECRRSTQQHSVSIYVSGGATSQSISPVGLWNATVTIPVSKGDTVIIEFYSRDNIYDTRYLGFIYANGSATA